MSIQPRFQVLEQTPSAIQLVDTKNNTVHTIRRKEISKFVQNALSDTTLSSNELRNLDQVFSDITKDSSTKSTRLFTVIHKQIDERIKYEENQGKDAFMEEFSLMIPDASSELKTEFLKLNPSQRSIFLDFVAKLHSKKRKKQPDESTLIDICKKIQKNETPVIKKEAKSVTFSDKSTKRTYNVYKPVDSATQSSEVSVETKGEGKGRVGTLRKKIDYQLPASPTERKLEEFFMDVVKTGYPLSTSPHDPNRKIDNEILNSMKVSMYHALQDITGKVEQGKLSPEKAVNELRDKFENLLFFNLPDRPIETRDKIFARMNEIQFDEIIDVVFEDYVNPGFMEFFNTVFKSRQAG